MKFHNTRPKCHGHFIRYGGLKVYTCPSTGKRVWVSVKNGEICPRCGKRIEMVN